MQKLLLPGLLALLAVLAAALWWLMDGGEVRAPDAPGTAASTTTGAANNLAAATGENGMAAPGDDTNNRVAVVDASDSRKDKGDPDAAFVGQVVDEKGSPVAGATVTCVPAQGFDPGDFDPSDFEFWDPSKQEERMAAQQKLRTEIATLADGSFRLVPRGDSRRVDLRVLARGYVVLQQNPQRPHGEDIDLGTLKLESGAIVSGRVLDRTGKAIEGAIVDRRDRGDWNGWGGFDPFGGPGRAGMRPGDESVTDSEGHFELPHVHAGSFSLRSRHPDHPVAQLEGLSVAPGKRLSDLLILTEAGATITGHVTDLPKERVQLRVLASPRAPDGQQLDMGGPNMVFSNNGEIFFGGGGGSSERSVDVAADGSFTLRGLHMDRTYTIWAMQSGAGQVGSSPCSQRLDVPSGGHDIKLRYEAGVTVLCHLIDSKHGTPIEQLVVTTRLRGGDQDGRTYWGSFGGNNPKPRDYPNGDVIIANLRPQPKQTLSLTIDAVGYERLQKDRIAMPMLGSLDLGTLRLEPTPVVDVAVTAAIDNQPVEGATVSLRQHRERGKPQNGPPVPGGPRTGKTDANGHCKLNGMPGQQVDITVTSKEHAPFQSEPIALPAEGNFQFAAQLLRGGDIEVQVFDADGKPVVEARVERRDDKGRGDNRTTDASGKALFERLVPGEHRFRIGRGDDPGNLNVPAPRPDPDKADDPSWTVASVADGGRTELVLNKQPTATLHGIVRENGLPLAGARVSFQNGIEDLPRDRNQPWFDGGNGMGNGTRTDEQGNYDMKELPPGEHRLRIWHRTRTMTATVAVTLRVGSNNRDVDLDVSSLRGVVRAPDGKPVAKANVSVAPAKESVQDGDPFGGWNGGRSAQTDAAGRYELRGVAADTPLTVTASADGFAAASAGPVEVAVRSSRDDVDIQLLAAGSIHVTVGPEAGRVWASARCVDGPSKDQQASWEQVEAKGATLSNLRPGRWSVRLTGGNGDDQERTVEVTAGQVTEVRF